ncbi:MAG: hypothetical protein LPK45_04560, partial [Bacteroidota bacterium]|nr:hypothetical protein [Bacteroidota bacterium]MDX5430327.1 hypothetical protein [Bacteroidota bacterium]MDX5469088.1 hypothetical protein [Bacteroidota bacterium]
LEWKENHAHIELGLGSIGRGYFEVGIQAENYRFGAKTGLNFTIDQQGVFRPKVYGQIPLWRRSKFPILSLGAAGYIATNPRSANGFEPYFGWRLPRRGWERLQMTTGLYFETSQTAEGDKRKNNVFAVGLKCRL